MARPVYFISDAHLGSSADPASDEDRLRRLVPFLRHVGERQAEHLYILGDLFDFWFEYAHVMPWRHARILGEIGALVERGVPVTFLGGNHDWWGGRVFREVARMTVHREPISVEHQGVRLFLAHGDGLSSSNDFGYLVLRAVLRNPVTIFLLRLVHPDLAYFLGHRISRFSRNYLTKCDFHVAPALAAFVDSKLASGHHAVLMGHLHAGYADTRASGGKLYVLGDWMSLFTAVRLEDGRFQWEDWSGGTAIKIEEPVSPIAGGHGD